MNENNPLLQKSVQTARQAGHFALILVGIYVAFLFAKWLDNQITGRQGGQVLQGGTFWKALTIVFKDARGQRVEVNNVSFRNVDTYLPIAVVVHMNGQDSTYYEAIQQPSVDVIGTGIDSLVIRTRNANHSTVIDDLSFTHGGKTYNVDFDTDAQGSPIAPNTQLTAYQLNGLQIAFGGENAVPTVVRGVDLGTMIGRLISQHSGPLSTALIIFLLALPFGLLIKYVRITRTELNPMRFYTEKDAQTIREMGIDVFQWGKFHPRGQGYAFEENTELYKILSSVGSERGMNPGRLIEYCTDRIDRLFATIEDSVSTSFGLLGILALSLGLLGTVVGMIDAFNILENTMKVGEGPAQIQLKMAHFINFALVTTVIGFIGRILSIILIRRVKTLVAQNQENMLDLIRHFGEDEQQASTLAAEN